jgi:hypothetical protein
MNAKAIATIPPIMNLAPIIANPSPSSLSSIICEIQRHTPPNTVIIIPADNIGLKIVVFLSLNDVSTHYQFVCY